MAREHGEEGQVVDVVEHDGRSALVSVPTVGFPEGFQLAPGARVVLAFTPSGPVVRPLVRGIQATVPADALARRGEVSLGSGRSVELQEATTVVEESEAGETQSGDVLLVIESGDPRGREQVMAVRSTRPKRE
jgi:hypothetical protein